MMRSVWAVVAGTAFIVVVTTIVDVALHPLCAKIHEMRSSVVERA